MNKTERIIDAARDRFRYYGIGKTTMQDIAQDADVAVGTLYLYFKNKDDLIVACTTEFVEQHRREVQAVLASNRPADEKLRQYITGRFRAAEATRSGSRHAAEVTRAVLRLKPDRIVEEGGMILSTLSQILEQGRAAGQFQVASIERDAKVFLLSIAYFFPNALNEPPIPATEPDLLAVVDWFIEQWSGRPRRTPDAARKRPHRVRK